MYHDAAYKNTTKSYTVAKTASTVYRAQNMIICSDIISSEITNIVQATRREAYA